MRALIELGLTNACVAAVLALIVAIISRFCRRPALVHCLWLLVLLKLVTPPLVKLPVAWLEPPVETTKPVAIAAEVVAPPAARAPAVLVVELPPPFPDSYQVTTAPLPPISAPAAALPAEPRPGPTAPAVLPLAETAPRGALPWRSIALGTWAVGSVLWLMLAMVRVVRFRRLLRTAWPAPEAVQAQAEELAESMGLWHLPGLWMVAGPVSPMLWALGGPARLILPQALWKTLDDDQRAALLVHELAHFKRRDHWVRHVELFVTGLYWWHPAVWWARGALREAEEQCCDAWVVWALPDSVRSYATALVQTLEFLADARPGLPVAASGVGQYTSLKRRLTMIMQATTPRSLSRLGWITVLGLAASLLPLAPSWAQRPAPQPQPQPAPAANAQSSATAHPEPQPEARLRDRVTQGELAIAKLELERAQERLEWARKMYEKGYVSKSQKTEEEIGLERARLALRLAENRLGSGDDQKSDDDKDKEGDGAKKEAVDKAEADLQKLQKQLHDLEARNLPEIEKARKELDSLMRDYHRQQQELHQQFMQAQQRLAQLQGRTAVYVPFTTRTDGGTTVVTAPSNASPFPGQAGTVYYTVPQGQTRIVGQPSPGAPAPAPVAVPVGITSDTERRLTELERKLDRLLGEFEKLKDGEGSRNDDRAPGRGNRP